MTIQGIQGGNKQPGEARLLEDLLQNAIPELVRFRQEADQERNVHRAGYDLRDGTVGTTSLVSPVAASHKDLISVLGSALDITNLGSGSEGLQDTLKLILKYSVNPSSPGFLDKLYAAPLPPGIIAELLLGVLNTNLHVYQVSPALTLIEKDVTKRLANMFGLDGPRSGGISVQGGSASNMTSIVVARNTLFPETKTLGNSAVDGRLILFTSAHGHYSTEKAAQALGFGSSNVVPVSVDECGRMRASELRRLVIENTNSGNTPFYVNATAGTTVLGSFDPFEEIARVARENGMWLHVDAAWGGGFVFSQKADIKKDLQGIGLADSIATNPHKMLGVPLTCSFLLAKDLKQFQDANTLKAGYLFHDEADDEVAQSKDFATVGINGFGANDETAHWKEPYDLADLTLQCGRRGDSLKLFMSWKYYGTQGYSDMVDNAHDLACHMSKLVRKQPNLTPVLPDGHGPSCLQVCFYYTPRGKFAHGLLEEADYLNISTEGQGLANEHVDKPSRKAELGRHNSKVTANIAKALISRGFMVDFAPALEGQEDKGSFFRVVVNISTIRETVERLVEEIVTVGDQVVANMKSNVALTSSRT